MTDISMILEGHHNPTHEDRVPIYISSEARERLHALLVSPAFQGTGVGYSAFIERACEVAETAIAEDKADREQLRRMKMTKNSKRGFELHFLIP